MTKKLDFLIGASFADLIFQPTAGIIAPDNMFVINFMCMLFRKKEKSLLWRRCILIDL